MARTIPSLALQNPGGAVNGALWNSGPKAVTDFYTGPPLFRARQTSVMSTNSGSWYAMLLNFVDIDTDSGHIANDSRYTSQVAGWYWCEGYVTWNITGGQSRSDVAIWKNSSLVLGAQQSVLKPSGDLLAVSASAIIYLAVGDYVEIQGLQNTGGTINTAAGTDLAPSLNVLWIHS